MPACPRILIIDGDPKRRALLERLLLSWQFDVVSAYDGYSGLRLIMNDRPEILVVGTDLPDWPSSTMMTGAARLGSRAKMVVLSKAALGNASRDAQRSVIGVVDSMDEPNELRQLITTVLNEIDGVWPAELSRD